MAQITELERLAKRVLALEAKLREVKKVDMVLKSLDERLSKLGV